MKTKTLLLAFLCIFLFTTKGHTDDPPSGSEIIYLQGKLDLNAGPDDIEAYVDGSAVHVYFHHSFGYVGVTLYSPLGVAIYNNVIDTEVLQHVVIPFFGNTSGTFTLVLENANGYVDGEFEHNNS